MARALLIATALLLVTADAFAHDVPEEAYQRLASGSWLDVVWIGAEHMLTGYDHLLFLAGVVFFLSRFGEVVKFVTAFTIGHVLVLLAATLARVGAEHHLIDAFIAVTVAYKGFENLGGFQRWIGVEPPYLLAMVFLFGLVHGLGLSNQLQTLTLADDPQLVPKVLLFNAGVEFGQIAALCVMVPVVNAWRRTIVWEPLARIANGGLVFTGVLLMLFQLHGYTHEDQAASSASSEWHSHGDGPLHSHE